MRVRLLAAVTSAALLAVAGCTSDASPEPAPLPTESASPGETSRPSPSAPTLPPEAQGTSPAAAKAFARHYVDAVNYGMASGNVSLLRALSARDCSVCDRIIGEIEAAYSDGGRLEGGSWKIVSLRYVRLGPGEAQVGLGLRIGRQASYTAESEAPSYSKATRGFLGVRALYGSGSWTATRLDATS